MLFKAKWNGSPWALCCGEWELYKYTDDNQVKNLSFLIPNELRTNCMNTFKEYSYWCFDDSWNEIWKTYKDGLKCEDWIKENLSWISNICNTKDEMKQLYEAFRKEDWRHTSCGGCI